jgi:hypothetical protein
MLGQTICISVTFTLAAADDLLKFVDSSLKNFLLALTEKKKGRWIIA